MVHHYVPTIHPFHQHFVNFPTPRCCHACSKSSHIATFGHSHPPCHPHPGVTLLQHWPQRPFFWEAGTLIGGPPVRVRLRPGTYHILVLTELQRICRTGAQGDRSLLNALSRKCYMHTLQYVHRGTLP